LKESDKVRGFKIQKIMENGVSVSRNGQSWFLSTPEVRHTRVHGIGVAKEVPKMSMTD
jgi:hypothetical protein